MRWLDHVVRQVLVQWGYLAMLAGLIGECARLPLPGETVLMFSGFLSHKGTSLQVQQSYFEKASLAMIAGLVVLGYYIWRHKRHLFEERQHRMNQM